MYLQYSYNLLMGFSQVELGLYLGFHRCFQRQKRMQSNDLMLRPFLINYLLFHHFLGKVGQLKIILGFGYSFIYNICFKIFFTLSNHLFCFASKSSVFYLIALIS